MFVPCAFGFYGREGKCRADHTGESFTHSSIQSDGCLGHNGDALFSYPQGYFRVHASPPGSHLPTPTHPGQWFRDLKDLMLHGENADEYSVRITFKIYCRALVLDPDMVFGI